MMCGFAEESILKIDGESFSHRDSKDASGADFSGDAESDLEIEGESSDLDDPLFSRDLSVEIEDESSDLDDPLLSKDFKDSSVEIEGEPSSDDILELILDGSANEPLFIPVFSNSQLK
jgi:hypothetical protein